MGCLLLGLLRAAREMVLAWFYAEASAAAQGAGTCSPKTEQRAHTTRKAVRARDAMGTHGTRQRGN